MKKKHFWSTLLVMAVALVCTSLVSCSSDSDDNDGGGGGGNNSLTGWWFCNPSDYPTANAIQFTGSNTAEFYFLVNKRDSEYSNAFSKKSGWYYNHVSIYIYTRVNDVIVFENGLKYTYKDGTLYGEDGYAFTKL